MTKIEQIIDGIIKVIKKLNVIRRLSGILKSVGSIVAVLLSDDELIHSKSCKLI